MTAVLVRLDQLVSEINARFGRSENYVERAREAAAQFVKKAKERRLAAGLLLIEARQLVPQGEWKRWVETNVNRSYSDVKKVMALAGAPDPAAALEQERETTREQVAEHRRAHTTERMSPEQDENGEDPTDPLEDAKAAVRNLSPADFTEFKAWFRSYCGAAA